MKVVVTDPNLGAAARPAGVGPAPAPSRCGPTPRRWPPTLADADGWSVAR